ncbi:hypothetical protein A2U01_0096785, partial [Trifolium medium]|nr:hypothetical protein [Trifolium medium]
MSKEYGSTGFKSINAFNLAMLHSAPDIALRNRSASYALAGHCDQSST